MQNNKGEMKIFLGLLVLTLIVVSRIIFFENGPNAYEKEIIFKQAVNQLNFNEFKEKRRDFINKETYLVYYEFPDNQSKNATQNETEQFIINKFKRAGWIKNSVIDEFENSKIINFKKRDVKYYCEVEIYKKGVAIRFRY